MTHICTPKINHPDPAHTPSKPSSPIGVDLLSKKLDLAGTWLALRKELPKTKMPEMNCPDRIAD